MCGSAKQEPWHKRHVDKSAAAVRPGARAKAAYTKHLQSHHIHTQLHQWSKANACPPQIDMRASGYPRAASLGMFFISKLLLSALWQQQKGINYEICLQKNTCYQKHVNFALISDFVHTYIISLKNNLNDLINFCLNVSLNYFKNKSNYVYYLWE